jgi:tetratricopeptide (TPR) repeat protein/predicted MPP superfamily phosphohydrolase
MASVKWLHLTDLHAGSRFNDDSWPTMKKKLTTDILEQCQKMDGVDFVLFSGDLTNSGQKEQYEEVKLFLETLWGLFKEKGYSPFFLSVPGNHDIARPSQGPVTKCMQRFMLDDELQTEFWKDKSSDYYGFVEECFKNYSHWYSELDLPMPKLTKGYLPGDFETSFTIQGLKIGVVGLNSAFLHFHDCDKNLCISPKQLNYLTNKDPAAWIEQQDLPLLMTHHPSTWLHSSCESNYRSLIYPPNSFFAHYYGHMHTAADYQLAIGGAEARRLRQGASLFGLEETSERQTRIHGYCAYSYSTDDYKTYEEIRPRVSFTQQTGETIIISNPEYTLNEGVLVNLISQPSVQTPPEENTVKDFSEVAAMESANPFDLARLTGQSVVSVPISLQEIEWQIPSVDDRDKNIRSSEQAQALELLNTTKKLWIKCDWGMRKYGFLSMLFDKKGYKDALVVKLDCDKVKNRDELFAAISEQTGLPLHSFLSQLTTANDPVIVFDNINIELLDSGHTLTKLVNIINEFDPRLTIVFLSRYSSNDFKNNFVELLSLSHFEVKSYVEQHPQSSRDMLDEDSLEAIYIKSSGVPMLIDELIEMLGVVTIEEIDDTYQFNEDEKEEPVPNALKTAVHNLASSADEVANRSYNLLKVLSLLPYGESLRRLKYVFKTKPFFPQHAIELERLSLLTKATLPISMATHGKRLGVVLGTNERILKVPRQVREYVNSCLPVEEKKELILKIAEIVLGEGWRYGSLKIINKKILGARGIKSQGPGNEHEVIKFVISQAIQNSDKELLISALRIGAAYCKKLESSKRYRDAVYASHEILQSIENDEYPYVKEIIISRGSSLRMLGRIEEAIELLEDVLINYELTNDQKKEVYIDLALAHKSENNFPKAREFSEEILSISKGKGSRALQARSILFETDKETNLQNLTELEVEARNNNSTTVANNIAYKLAKSQTADKKVELYNKIISSDGDLYNKIRAAASKVTFLFSEHKPNDVSRYDLQIVQCGYLLLSSQRMESLLVKCHDALWRFFEQQKRYSELLRIFRLSSLIWRLVDSEEIEHKYFKKLSTILPDGTANNLNNLDCAYYHTRNRYYSAMSLD